MKSWTCPFLLQVVPPLPSQHIGFMNPQLRSLTRMNIYPLKKNLPIDIVNREVALFVKLGFSQGREMHYPRVHVNGWILHIHSL